MKLRWTPAASDDLQSINDYLKANYPHYRAATVRKLYESVLALRQFPFRGRPGREENTRELVFSPLPYIAVYRVTPNSVEVLRIYHAARDIS
jgi:addiction module RelE/StbE family toxin